MRQTITWTNAVLLPFGSSGTWHDSCTVVACAKFFRYITAKNGITVKWIFLGFGKCVSEMGPRSQCVKVASLDGPLASLVTTKRILESSNYGFLVVIMLLMYSVPHCLYSVGNEITTTKSIVNCSWLGYTVWQISWLFDLFTAIVQCFSLNY